MPVYVNIPILLIIFMLGYVLSQQWHIFNILGKVFIFVLFLTICIMYTNYLIWKENRYFCKKLFPGLNAFLTASKLIYLPLNA